MAWVRIDDQAPRNEKMLLAGPAACWLWVCGIAHCQSQLTDGYISAAALPMIGVAKDYVKLAAKLVEAGLWDVAEKGYRVHDYLEFNQSKAQVLAKRSEDAARKHAGERKRSEPQVSVDSATHPVGIRAESEAPRAGIPSHPIPSKEERSRGDVLPMRSSGVLSGSLHRDHLHHACCSPTFSVCVPNAVHDKLSGQLAPKYGGDIQIAKVKLLAWYAVVWASLPADFVMGDAFKFWQARFDAEFASKDPAIPKAGKPEPAYNIPGVDATQEYLRRLRSPA